MLTTTESRLLRVLIALRDATGAKTRTPVSEDLVADLLAHDPEFDGPVAEALGSLLPLAFKGGGRGWVANERARCPLGSSFSRIERLQSHPTPTPLP